VGTLRERERELAAVEVLLDGRGGVLVIEGRAGIGKTSLVEVACSRAAGLGYEVVRGRGSQLEAGSRSVWCVSCSNGGWRLRGRASVRRCWPGRLARCGRCCPVSAP